MSVFLTIVRLGFKRISRYPWDNGLFLFIPGAIVFYMHILVYTTVYNYNQSQTILDYSLRQMLGYLAASQLLWSWTANSVDYRLSTRIMQGDLVQDLLRPIPILIWELGESVANLLGGVIFAFIPSCLTFSLMLGLDFLSPVALLRFMLAASMTFLLTFAINFLLGLTTLYLQSIRTLISFRYMIVAFLAGAFIPLEFFPSGVQRILHSLPFVYVWYWPIQFFLNRGAAGTWEEFLFRLGIALFWFIILVVLGQLLWRQAVRKYTDVGG